MCLRGWCRRERAVGARRCRRVAREVFCRAHPSRNTRGCILMSYHIIVQYMSIHVTLYCVTYIYIYIEREREIDTHTYIYVERYIYIYIYTYIIIVYYVMYYYIGFPRCSATMARSIAWGTAPRHALTSRAQSNV